MRWLTGTHGEMASMPTMMIAWAKRQDNARILGHASLTWGLKPPLVPQLPLLRSLGCSMQRSVPIRPASRRLPETRIRPKQEG